MNQMLRCDWLPDSWAARWSYLALSGLPAVSRKKTFPESHMHIIKMAGYWPRSFFASLRTSTPSLYINTQRSLGQQLIYITPLNTKCSCKMSHFGSKNTRPDFYSFQSRSTVCPRNLKTEISVCKRIRNIFRRVWVKLGQGEEYHDNRSYKRHRFRNASFSEFHFNSHQNVKVIHRHRFEEWSFKSSFFATAAGFFGVMWTKLYRIVIAFS